MNYNYIYFDEDFIPYYVGKGIMFRDSRSRDLVDHKRVSVPPPERILRFDQECAEAALAFESYLIKRIGRRADCCGNREDEKIGPLMNRTDGGLGATNPCESMRKAQRLQGQISGHVSGRANGRRNVESGHLARISKLGGRKKGDLRLKLNGRNWGLTGGLIAAERGQVGRVAGRRALCIRWHKNRGIVKPGCITCPR
jgi:hypothetical protein